jgi:hypothetical protein
MSEAAARFADSARGGAKIAVDMALFDKVETLGSGEVHPLISEHSDQYRRPIG